MLDVSRYEAIVVGCGLTGSVVARCLAENRNMNVLVVDRRNHIAGNLYDYVDENNFRVQLYGPHTFHTVKKELYDYVNEFAEWEEFYLTCMAQINGKFTPSPFNFQTIDDYFDVEKAEKIKDHIHKEYGNAEKATIVEMLKSKDIYVKEFADFLFDYDYSLYTAKQWGISPTEIDTSVLKRVPVVFSYKTGYFDDEFQVMPKDGFAGFIANILDHENISVELNIDAKDILSICNEKLLLNGEETNKIIVYTGAIDELLNCKYGVLPYRSLRFEFRTEMMNSFQDAPVVAYPQAEGFTRITEYTKIPVQMTNGKTVVAVEYPLHYEAGLTEPYYPILTSDSQLLYAKYREEVERIHNLYVCGRLGDFKYYNMDQALEQALLVAKSIANECMEKKK